MDADEDCMDTRHEILQRDSVEPVELDKKGCNVLFGSWVCPYTGEEISDPKMVDIDHIVPLKNAHESGAHAWEDWERSLFFNSPGNLRAVSMSANRSKGNQGPSEWLPPDMGFRCQFVKDWLSVKNKWGLEMDCKEAQATSAAVSEYCF